MFFFNRWANQPSGIHSLGCGTYIVFYSPVVAELKGTCPLKGDRDTQEADSTTVSLAIDNPKAWAEPHTMEGNRLPKGRKPQLECEINVYS